MKLRISSDYRIGSGVPLAARHFVDMAYGEEGVSASCTACDFRAMKKRPRLSGVTWMNRAAAEIRSQLLSHIETKHANVLGQVVRESRGHIVEVE